MLDSTPFRSANLFLLKGVARLLMGVAALLGFLALSWFYEVGSVLNDLLNIGPFFSGAATVLSAFLIGLVGVLLKGFAERIESRDDGELVKLAIGEARESDKQQ
jgi:hypothetical protein